MLAIKKKFIVDENQKKIAVQLDIATFQRIEALLEDRLLIRAMKKNRTEDNMNLNEARTYYKKLPKAM